MHRATIYRWPCITRVITFRELVTRKISTRRILPTILKRVERIQRVRINESKSFTSFISSRKNSSLRIRYLKKFQSWRNNFSSKKERRIIFKIQTSISNAIERRLKKFFHKEKKKRNKSAISLSLSRERLVFERFRKEWKWHWRYNRIITLYYDIHSPYRGACSPCLNGIFQGRSYQWSNIDKSRDSVPCGARLSSAARTDAYKFPSDVNCRFYVGCELWNRQCGQWTGKGIDRERKRGGSPTLRKSEEEFLEENHRSKI